MGKLYITVEQAQAQLEVEIAEAHDRYRRRVQQIARDQEKTAKSPPTLDRYQLALDMRKAGKTYQEIGQALGVGKQRASEIVSKAKRVLSRVDIGLSVRAENAIKHFIYLQKNYQPAQSIDLSPHAISRISAREMERMHNCGRVTIAEIRRWLGRHGLDLAP